MSDVAVEVKATPSTATKFGAEVLGTFLLVFGVIGTALFSASASVGWLGVAFAVGLAVLVGAFAFGHISGGHFNPAVTIGLAVAKRFSWSEVGLYIVAQLIGGIIATSLLFAIAAGNEDSSFLKGLTDAGFASNGFGAHSPGGFGLVSVIIAEVVLTAVLVWVILGTTDFRATPAFAAIAIGFSLTVIHLIAIPISNASVNPARSIATAIYGGGDALAQVWVFIVAPIVGAIIAGFTYEFILGPSKKKA